MDRLHAWLIPAMWIAWTAYWFIAARGAKSDSRQESAGSRASHILPLLLGAYLVWAHRLPGDFPGGHLWPSADAAYFIGAAVVALGLGFSIWARAILGRNWSGIVTVKQDHELVRSGPYRWVRHPIYTGLLVAFAGSAIVIGQWRGLLGVALIFAALWRKLRLEERWMVETFGDAYVRYQAEVPALIPFVI